MKLVNPLEHGVAYAIGFLITFLAGFTVPLILECSTEKKPESVPRTAIGGFTLGILERTALYFTMMVGASQFVGIWLAFKVASKWKVWDTITKIDMKSDPGPPDFEVRRLWGSRLYQRFVQGTLLNILYAGLGIMIAQVLAHNCSF
jgi:hypothetical protein